MRKRILDYCADIERLIAEDSSSTDWIATLNDLMVQIAFFQHERLIHLIVTVTFALLELLSFILLQIVPGIPSILLTILILILLIPYIRHYYLLENKVQQMYTYYDAIKKKL